jgi:hypothetical protein
MDGCIDVPKKFFEAAEEETWWEVFKCLLEFEDKEPHLCFPASRVATDEFCCIMTMSSTTSTPRFLESALLDPSPLIA